MGQSWSFSPSHWWPACWGAVIAAASSNGEAARRASSRSAELLKFIPLCILQYPPFFSLPLSKQQASRHLGYFKFVPPRSNPPPTLTLSLTRTHTHTHTHVETTLKGNGYMFCFGFFVSASFTRVNILVFLLLVFWLL